VSARYVRLWSNGSNVNPYNHYVEVQVFAAGGGGTTQNLALGKVPTASAGVSGQPISVATDGDTNSNNWTQIGLTGPQWLRIDLGQAYSLNEITVWHYAGDGRTYHDVIIQASNDVNFATGVSTVFNNDNDNSSGQGVGSQAEYVESTAGKDITFAAVSARYVRLWTNGSNVNPYNHYVEVQVFGAGGGGPTVSSFGASPSSVTSGQSSTLSWNVSGATSLSISGVGTVTPVTSGSVTVTPPATTTYTLTATNASGTTTATTTVTVSGPGSAPVINSFVANPPTITSGLSSSLVWNVSGANLLSIGGIGSVTPVTTGSAAVTPSATTTYTLSATNSFGTTTATATVTVSPVPPPTTLKTFIYFSAHQDDWVLFAGAPAYDNFRDTNAKKHVVIAITAGDEGASWDDLWPKHPYILARDHGMIESFTYGGLLLSGASGYTVATDGANGQKVVNGHTIMTFTPVAVMGGTTSTPEPKANLNVVIYFLHLPDGQVDGSGWATHGNVSLQKFLSGAINQISSLDHLTTYTSPADLQNTIAAAILQEMAPGTTGVAYYPLQATQSIGNPGDHSDHYQTGKIAEAAIVNGVLSTCVSRIGFVGYDIANRARNLSDAEYQGKTMLYGVNTAAVSLYGWYEGGWNSKHLGWVPENYTSALSSSNLACR
jgi:hypothetical protein